MAQAEVGRHLIGYLTQRPLERLGSGRRDDQEIDVLGEALDQPERLGQARAALEDDSADTMVVRARRAEHLGSPVVLLDGTAIDPEALGGGVPKRLELGG